MSTLISDKAYKACRVFGGILFIIVIKSREHLPTCTLPRACGNVGKMDGQTVSKVCVLSEVFATILFTSHSYRACIFERRKQD